MCSKRNKRINVRPFDMITNKNESKATIEYISCDCKCKFNSTTCNSNEKWDDKTCQCECVKIIVHAKKITVGILAHVFDRIVSI